MSSDDAPVTSSMPPDPERPEPADQVPLEPDPVAYDSERNAAARARGLAAPYIPGGRDPDQEAANRQDRRYVRLLVIMVVAIVLAGFALGFLAVLVGFGDLARG